MSTLQEDSLRACSYNLLAALCWSLSPSHSGSSTWRRLFIKRIRMLSSGVYVKHRLVKLRTLYQRNGAAAQHISCSQRTLCINRCPFIRYQHGCGTVELFAYPCSNNKRYDWPTRTCWDRWRPCRSLRRSLSALRRHLHLAWYSLDTGHPGDEAYFQTEEWQEWQAINRNTLYAVQ
jgi:hypothetical protein